MMLLLCFSYSVWGMYRSGAGGFEDEMFPRPFPYPDSLLLEYALWLDARNPTPPNSIKFHGEWPTVWLTCLILAMVFLVGLGFSVFQALRRPKGNELPSSE
ncbi:MAG: hypothetical protein M5U26_12010 [Planctomycetota bacterium]|nr:hypothetical protein [Planctomycetota bacterium]